MGADERIAAALERIAAGIEALHDRTAWMREHDAQVRAQIAAKDREVKLLRLALVEAAACPRCGGRGWGSMVDGAGAGTFEMVCAPCEGTGIRASLSDETQVATATAKEALGG